MSGGHLRVVVCGAGPAADVGRLIVVAHESGWSTSVIATTAALDFVNSDEIERLSGVEVRTSFQASGSAGRVLSPVDALIVAPATFNTVNKLALGIADNYALTSAAELIGRGVPTVIVPFVNSALAGRAPFPRSVAALRSEGVTVLLGPDEGWEPHPPGTGVAQQELFPWPRSFELAIAGQGNSTGST